MVNELDRRDQFLIAMYNQLMNDINRHIVVVWQSVATLVAAIAAFSLVKDQIISLDVATSIILITCIWLLLHVYDASYWYNRNLVIIANIERQFLIKEDLRDIHYYFGKHRPKGTMLSHLQIQRALGVAVGVLVLGVHFYKTILPAIDAEYSIEFLNIVPWLVAVSGILLCICKARDNNEKYAEFLKNSPGIEVDTTGVSYGIGHGFRGKHPQDGSE